MILRRIIQHVRKQEWTAIVIDLLIVVVGQQDQRMNLHFELDRELGISHSDDLLD